MAEESVVTEATETPSFSFEGKSESEVFAPTPDPAIEEKDEKIIEEGRENTKPDQPEAVPGASPKDIPERADEDKITPEKETKFANENSEKIYNLLREGKEDEVVSILAEQKKLSEVDKLSPEDVIKLSLQYQNKDFTEKEVADLFAETYELPEAPEQEYSETDEEFEKREEKYKKQVDRINARMERDAKPAIKELEKYKQEIILPELSKPENVFKELTQDELDAQQKLQDQFTEVATAELNNFKGYEGKFKSDEAEFSVNYKLSAKDKEQIQPLIAQSYTDAPGFLQKIGWLDKDGNLNASKLAEDLPLIMNKAEILTGMVSDSSSEMRRALTKNIKNVDVSGGKSTPEMGKSNEEKTQAMVSHFFSQ